MLKLRVLAPVQRLDPGLATSTAASRSEAPVAKTTLPARHLIGPPSPQHLFHGVASWRDVCLLALTILYVTLRNACAGPPL
jgi:hypothetical protein